MNGMRERDVEDVLVNGMTAEAFEEAVRDALGETPADPDAVNNLWAMRFTVEEAVEDLRFNDTQW